LDPGQDKFRKQFLTLSTSRNDEYICKNTFNEDEELKVPMQEISYPEIVVTCPNNIEKSIFSSRRSSLVNDENLPNFQESKDEITKEEGKDNGRFRASKGQHR
jgi:hypothetical protein